MSGSPAVLSRRAVLRGALASVAAVAMGGAAAACTSSRRAEDAGRPSTTPAPSSTAAAEESGASTTPTGAGGVLLAYFSRAGENYYYGGRRDLDVGNTEVLAGMISRLLGCDVYRIEAADPYPEDYEATVVRNVREQDADARPAIANALPRLDRYETVLLASPIWNVRAPMIMATFTEALDFAGKTVHPVTTYAMSGLGTTERDYAASCPGATIAEGLAVQGEEVAAAEPTIRAWLQRTGLLAR
jgi:flavodoxin